MSKELSPTGNRVRAAVVTGGARGIGFACAQRLAQEGVRCALLDIDEAGAQSSAQHLGTGHLGLKADVTSTAELSAAMRRALVALR